MNVLFQYEMPGNPDQALKTLMIPIRYFQTFSV